MRRGWLLSGAAAVAMAALAQSAMANEELLVMQENPANWVMPLNNYSSTRYSELGQINKDNVGDLQVAWTFSTGVLRGHEGGPLVIGDIMYIHTPFPNIVYALDLNDPGRVIWKYEPQQDPDTIPVMCCDTVNRGPGLRRGQDLSASGRYHFGGAGRADRRGGLDRDQRRSQEGRDRDQRADGDRRQGADRHLGRRVRRAGSRHRLQHQRRQDGVAWLFDRARRSDLARSRGHDPSGPAGRREFRHRHLGRRAVEAGRRHHLGLDVVRPGAESGVLRLGQSRHLEPDAASRRQSLVDDHLRPQS